LKKDLEQFEQLSEFGDVRLVLCVWGASIAYSQSLVILKRMFEWCSIVGVPRRHCVCSQECRENFMKFSKDRLTACVTEKKSVGEKDHPSELSDGR